MAITVSSAFSAFYGTVNVPTQQSQNARSSRDWLKGRIASIGDNIRNFPTLAESKNIDFGSFARRTKIKVVDDVDMMFGLHGSGAFYESTGQINQYRIVVTDNPLLSTFCDTNYSLLANHRLELNSRKILNKFKRELSSIPQYSQAAMKSTEQAVTLKLTSYPWNFDIVPCFQTVSDADTGRNYYLIPDAKGHWMKTDPRIDRQRVTATNQAHGGNVLQVIRLIKYWNSRQTMRSASSYLLENMVLDYFDSITPNSWPLIGIWTMFFSTLQVTFSHP